MHETSLINALLDQVEGHARKHQAKAVGAIHIGLGELSGVEPELFSLAWETMRQASPLCAETPLHLRRVPARWECRLCKAPIAKGEVLTCPNCQVPAKLVEGDELILERIELEVP